jgi:agmatinase
MKTAETTIQLLGAPYDAASSFMRGAARGPFVIRDALHSGASNLWSETGLDLEPLLHDAGNIDFAAVSDPLAAIEDAVANVCDQGAPLILGGDHFVTWPAVRAVARARGPLSIVVFDAHPDLYDELEGDRHSHACPFARIMEEGLATRLVQVGIRAATGHQREQAARFGVEMIEMRSMRELPRLAFDEPVYLSFDMDALDPAFAPGISHWEPGGLSVRDALHIIQGMEARLVAADVVECNPLRDRAGRTAHVAAKIVKEIAGAMAAPVT